LPDLHEIPPIEDPCWDDKDWRKTVLLRVRETESLSNKDIARLTGASHNTVRFWTSEHHVTIGASTLRALLYDLNARHIPAIRGASR